MVKELGTTTLLTHSNFLSFFLFQFTSLQSVQVCSVVDKSHQMDPTQIVV